MLLEGKTAAIYGGGGAIGGAVARTFARASSSPGVRSARSSASPPTSAPCGAVDVGRVDAVGERMVDDHAEAVAGAAGGIDISFNLISRGDVQGTAMAEMEVEDRLRPVATAVRTLSSPRAWRRATCSRGAAG